MRFNVYFAEPYLPLVENPTSFRLVATLDARNREEAFRLTNSLDSYWGDDPAAGAIGGPHRSMSVGDILYAADGRAWECAFYGWERLDGAEARQMGIASPQAAAEPAGEGVSAE